jgi:hypothetical protein
MSYQANKPYGRRRTDKSLSPDEHRKLQSIRHEVDEDSSGLIRRYMRLASKVLGSEGEPLSAQKSSARKSGNPVNGRAA